MAYLGKQEKTNTLFFWHLLICQNSQQQNQISIAGYACLISTHALLENGHYCEESMY